MFNSTPFIQRINSVINHGMTVVKELFTLYRMSQQERSIFWEVIVLVFLTKIECAYVLFRTVSEIEVVNCTVPKLLIRKINYVLFLIPVFIIQVTKLVQFT
jgi:hypothetical protein